MNFDKTHDGVMNNIESIMDFEGWNWEEFSKTKQYNQMSNAIWEFFRCVELGILTDEGEDD